MIDNPYDKAGPANAILALAWAVAHDDYTEERIQRDEAQCRPTWLGRKIRTNSGDHDPDAYGSWSSVVKAYEDIGSEL